MKNKGYVLLIVLILSVIIALIGAGLAFMSKQGFLSTRANTLFNKLQKASHYGINEAIRRIVVSQGVCEEGIFNQDLNVDGVRVRVSTSRRGILCALRAEATLGGARQVIVATTQGFYGIGTFTVKANERVEWLGGAYVSGCDSQNSCNIPGIIVSGPINGVPPGAAKNCGVTGTTGIYGTPPLKPNVRFYDLVPLTFNVNCFYELLHMFETEDNYTGYPMGLGKNPFWKINNNTRQDIEFDKGGLTSCPNPLVIDEPELVWNRQAGDFTIRSWTNDIPSIPPKCEFNGNALNLSQDLPTCTWIRVKKDVNITGVAPNIKFVNASGYQVTISNAGNANVITDKTIIVESKTVSEPLILYTTNKVTINGTATYIRVVSQGNIELKTPSTISNSTLITPNSIINTTHNNLTLKEVNVFARRVNFTQTTTISGGMYYLFGYVESVCNSNDPDASIVTTSANIGTLETPVLFIMVNSCLRVTNPTPIYFNGIFFAEGPTCIVYQNIRFTGISIWNEPNNFENVDQLGSGFYIQFNYGIINTLNNKFWYVRRFECIKDDPLPYAQAILTYHSSY
ncbi:MAG: hypothetical protein C0190_05295 [Thermodesulfobacterium geofontis]|uniref:Uncharacterized protein n=1 Tax=Thermodesulfobacterium geofontis TaxID=1295609 RepID=A0A2N7PMV0_9BACT|nr:MAG: hypothetical protein C0190_05295 [Thermodesulfobacterium geofontis]